MILIVILFPTRCKIIAGLDIVAFYTLVQRLKCALLRPGGGLSAVDKGYIGRPFRGYCRKELLIAAEVGGCKESFDEDMGMGPVELANNPCHLLFLRAAPRMP